MQRRGQATRPSSLISNPPARSPWVWHPDASSCVNEGRAGEGAQITIPSKDRTRFPAGLRRIRVKQAAEPGIRSRLNDWGKRFVNRPGWDMVKLLIPVFGNLNADGIDKCSSESSQLVCVLTGCINSDGSGGNWIRWMTSSGRVRVKVAVHALWLGPVMPTGICIRVPFDHCSNPITADQHAPGADA